MAKRYIAGVIFAFVLGLIGGELGTMYLLKPSLTASLQRSFEQTAVRVGAAKWDADETGAPKFAWMKCSALGVPR